MARITITTGIILTLLGVGAYGWALSGDQASLTALIPAFFGLPLLTLGGLVSAKPRLRALLMHLAVLLALLGLLGSARGLPSLPKLITAPDELERPMAVLVQSIMAGVCLVYIVLAVRSFIAARRGGAAAS